MLPGELRILVLEKLPYVKQRFIKICLGFLDCLLLSIYHRQFDFPPKSSPNFSQKKKVEGFFKGGRYSPTISQVGNTEKAPQGQWL